MVKYFTIRCAIICIAAALCAVLVPGASRVQATSPASTGTPVAERLVTISVNNIDIHDFFRGLSRTENINIITSKDVSGTISVELYNVPLEEALQAVSLANGYQCRKKENIYFIVKEEKKEEEEATIGSVIRGFRVNYADILEVHKVVEDIVGEDQVTAHLETKTIIVDDSLENVQKVEKIIQKLDFAPQQVLIEAKILEITLGGSLSLGVDWEKTFTSGGFSGTISTKDFALPSNAEGAKGFFFEVMRDNLKLKAFLDALESRSDINVLATPKLLAIDNKPAEIIIGGRLGYYLVTTTETSTLQSVEFLNIGTQLKIKPQISREGKILMQIHPEVSEGTVDALGLPSTNTTEVTTSLLAEDGDTIFIGGLIRKRKQRIKTGVPFLGRIPLLGTAFGRTEDRETKTEIVILITPHIVTSENKQMFAESINKIERAEESHQKERNTLEKLVIAEKMYAKVQGEDKVATVPITTARAVVAQPEERLDGEQSVEAVTAEDSGQSAATAAPSPEAYQAVENQATAPVYSLLVSTFYEKENAAKLEARLIHKGYPAYVLTGQDKDGRPISAVKLGPVMKYRLAEDYVKKLQQEGVAPLIITEGNP